MPGGFDRMLAFAPGGKRLLTRVVGEKSGIGSWDVASGRLTKVFEWNGPLESSLASSNKELCVTAGGGKILMLTHMPNRRDDECYLTVWDAASGQRERKRARSLGRRERAHTGWSKRARLRVAPGRH